VTPDPGRPRLPSVLIASDARHAVFPPPGIDAGVLVRDTDLAALVHRANSDDPPQAVDIDSVAGLGGDDAAVDFVVGRLGIRIVLTRRPQLAARVADQGGLGLVHVFAYDSTGMHRSLEGHPRIDHVGSVLSPGLVIVHLRPEELDALPRPIVAYGLIDELGDARACASLSDAVVVRPAMAAKLAAGLVPA
jgi:glycerol-3-phosphate responsive antiterminator